MFTPTTPLTRLAVSMEVARTISALVPSKPKIKLLGGYTYRLQLTCYGTFMDAALGAWKHAATIAFSEANSRVQKNQFIFDYQENLDTITNCQDIRMLETMCNPENDSIFWIGRRPYQV